MDSPRVLLSPLMGGTTQKYIHVKRDGRNNENKEALGGFQGELA